MIEPTRPTETVMTGEGCVQCLLRHPVDQLPSRINSNNTDTALRT